MSKETNCFYCTKDQRLQDLMLEIGPLEAATLYLMKEQTYYGRCVVAYQRHFKELYLLEPAELARFMNDVGRAARAIQNAFKPSNINLGFYNDLGGHLHCHVVPKYEGGYGWGTTFEMVPAAKKLLSAEDYAAMINQIKQFLR